MGIKNKMLTYAEEKRRCKCGCCTLDDDLATHEDFERRIIAEIDRAVGRIIIYSPYLTMEGATRFKAAIIRARARGVVVDLYIREPNDWWCRESEGLKYYKLKKLSALADGITFMQLLGVHVTLRKGIHEKVVITDDRVMWFGCLNMTSYTGETSELMERKPVPRKVRRMIEELRLNECEHCLGHLGHRTLLLNPDCTTLYGAKNMKSSEYTRLIGYLVRRIRNERNLSKEDLSAIAGVAVNTIKKLEDGYNVQRDIAQKICAALTMPLQPVPRHLVPSLFQFFCKSCSDHKCLREFCLEPSFVVEVQQVLANMRRNMKITQREAAPLLGLTQMQLCSLESGTRSESLNKSQELCSAYGMVLVPLIATTPGIESFLTESGEKQAS